MSDFTFACPHCQQHLSADASIVGMQVDCPSCSGQMTVPTPSPAPPAINAAVEEVAKVCPYCRSAISDGEPVRICPTCKTPHHSDCWKENKGCTVFGCALAPPDEEKISVAIPADALQGVDNSGPHRAPLLVKPATSAPGAVSSLVWGIIGFFFCGMILGCVAISNANKAKKLIRDKPSEYSGEGLATAGLVMGIIDVVAWGLVLLAKIVGNT